MKEEEKKEKEKEEKREEEEKPKKSKSFRKSIRKRFSMFNVKDKVRL
jgi:hypothetical protein